MKIQQIFNRIWNHYMILKQQLSHSDGCPKYRGDDDAKCVIGLLIPDELYRPAMEGLAVDTVLARWPAFANHILDLDANYAEVNQIINFLHTMQEVHDNAIWNGNTGCIYPLDNKTRQAILHVSRTFELCCPQL